MGFGENNSNQKQIRVLRLIQPQPQNTLGTGRTRGNTSLLKPCRSYGFEYGCLYGIIWLHQSFCVAWALNNRNNTSFCIAKQTQSFVSLPRRIPRVSDARPPPGQRADAGAPLTTLAACTAAPGKGDVAHCPSVARLLLSSNRRCRDRGLWDGPARALSRRASRLRPALLLRPGRPPVRRPSSTGWGSPAS